MFVATFGVVVLAHGLYDSFLSLPALTDYSLVCDADLHRA